ncbi:hypothetical protein V1511DRAFT_505105 [Dipodascopsis uninucleata]
MNCALLMEQPKQLSHYSVIKSGDIFYISNFLSEEEERNLISKIYNVPPAKWVNLSHRRLQTYPTQLLKGSVLPTKEGLPQWLVEPFVKRMQYLGIWLESPHKTANHCLINEYSPGQGIMPHEDGPVYFPMVATVSLQDSIVLDIYNKTEDASRDIAYRIYQEPRSLLITTGSLYTDYLHGIQEIDIDYDLDHNTVANWSLLRAETREKISQCDGKIYRSRPRISLTFRDVKKVLNLTRLL